MRLFQNSHHLTRRGCPGRVWDGATRGSGVGSGTARSRVAEIGTIAEWADPSEGGGPPTRESARALGPCDGDAGKNQDAAGSAGGDASVRGNSHRGDECQMDPARQRGSSLSANPSPRRPPPGESNTWGPLLEHPAGYAGTDASESHPSGRGSAAKQTSSYPTATPGTGWSGDKALQVLARSGPPLRG